MSAYVEVAVGALGIAHCDKARALRSRSLALARCRADDGLSVLHLPRLARHIACPVQPRPQQFGERLRTQQSHKRLRTQQQSSALAYCAARNDAKKWRHIAEACKIVELCSVRLRPVTSPSITTT